jgi:hypothetical protein
LDGSGTGFDSSFGGGDALLLLSSFAGAGSSAGISSEEMSSPASAMTAMRVPTLMPLAPSDVCVH